MILKLQSAHIATLAFRFFFENITAGCVVALCALRALNTAHLYQPAVFANMFEYVINVFLSVFSAKWEALIAPENFWLRRFTSFKLPRSVVDSGLV